MTERLKLKRGLSDISPLFSEARKKRPRLSIHQPQLNNAKELAELSVKSKSPEIIFSWSAEGEGDAHFLNNYLASKLVTPRSPGLLMHVGSNSQEVKTEAKTEAWGRSLRRLSLSEDQLDQAFSSKSWTSSNQVDSAEHADYIFLEMNMRTLAYYPDLVKSLDRVVLFIHPQVESITEAYRKLKKLVSKGLQAEVVIVFDAEDASGLSSRVYELFSDFVSKRLSLSTNYLGILHLSRGGSGLSQDLRWDSWNYNARFRSESVEKLRFLSWVEQTQEVGICQ